MEKYIGYSLKYLLKKINDKPYKIFYNTQNINKDSLYVTNIKTNDDGVICITVSNFII